jgi:TonB-dependent receptor-like protein
LRLQLILVAGCAAACLCARVSAAPSDPPPLKTSPAAALPASGQSVTSYAASFFAPMKPTTAYDMISNLPGFTLDTGGGVRGFGGAAGNVLIDGDRPATKSDALDAILLRIPASSVARIDLIRGGAPGIDMQGKTVIANVVRKVDTTLHVTTSALGTESFNGHGDYAGRLEASQRIGDIALEGALLAQTGVDDGTGDGPHTVTTPAGLVTERDLIHDFGDGGAYKASGALEAPVLGGKLRIEGSYLRTPYASRNVDLSPFAADRQTENFQQDTDTAEMGARYVRRFGGVGLEVFALQQLSRYGETDVLFQPADVSTFQLGKHQGESILRGLATFDARPGLTLESGLEGDYNWLTSHTVETDQGAPVTVPAGDVRVTEARGEAFVDATWRARPTLTFEAGVRVEASKIASTGDVTTSETFIFPKPRFVVTWNATPRDQIQMRLEREVGQLDFGNFAATGTLGQGEHAGNPHLIPQQDWVIEATYDRRVLGDGDASLTARRYWFQDVIDDAGVCAATDVIPGTNLCNPAFEFAAPANIGAASKEELAAALTLPTDKLFLPNGQLILRATWRHSQVIDPATHRPREISGLHPVDSEAHFKEGFPKLKSTFSIDVFPAWRASEYLFSEVDTQRLGLWVDAVWEYKPSPDVAIKIEADNLASHGMEQVRAFYAPFRDVGGGQLSSVDTRAPRFGPELTFRVRKTFG